MSPRIHSEFRPSSEDSQGLMLLSHAERGGVSGGMRWCWHLSGADRLLAGTRMNARSCANNSVNPFLKENRVPLLVA